MLKFLGQPIPPTPTLCDRALKLIDDGEARFQEAIKFRKLTPDEQKLLDHGFWSIGLIIDPVKADAIPTQDFMERLASSNPRYTGWPVWLDARLMSNAESRPKVVKDAFEYLIVSISEGFSNHIDFARLNPQGEFFLHRLLQDDGVPSRVTPGKAIDPILMILRVAEAMGVGIAFAKALGSSPDQTTLGFAFRWHKLKGRQLSGWAKWKAAQLTMIKSRAVYNSRWIPRSPRCRSSWMMPLSDYLLHLKARLYRVGQSKISSGACSSGSSSFGSS